MATKSRKNSKGFMIYSNSSIEILDKNGRSKTERKRKILSTLKKFDKVLNNTLPNLKRKR